MSVKKTTLRRTLPVLAPLALLAVAAAGLYGKAAAPGKVEVSGGDTLLGQL